MATLSRRRDEDMNSWGLLDLKDVRVDVKLKYYMHYKHMMILPRATSLTTGEESICLLRVWTSHELSQFLNASLSYTLVVRASWPPHC